MFASESCISLTRHAVALFTLGFLLPAAAPRSREPHWCSSDGSLAGITARARSIDLHSDVLLMHSCLDGTLLRMLFWRFQLVFHSENIAGARHSASGFFIVFHYGTVRYGT